VTNLRTFVKTLEEEGDVLHIDDALAVEYEIPAVMRALDGGKALVFRRVKGHRESVVSGVCGTRTRIARALDCDATAVHQRLRDAMANPEPPEEVATGPVCAVTDAPHLTDMPILTHYARDGGPYLTAAVLYAVDPETDMGNLSIHRLQVLDETHLAVRIVPRHLYRLCQKARTTGNTLDVSIAVGLHPAILLAASSPVPFGLDEYHVANVLMGGTLQVIRCARVHAVAPADAELVLEGRLLLDREALEGPFTDLTGTYDVQRNQPVIEVLSVQRRDPYRYQALLPAGSEHRLLMGMPQEIRVWDYAQNVIPTVTAVNMTLGGCGWLHCVVGVAKFRDGDGKNVLLSVFAANPSIKHAIVVDADIDVYDMREVEWALATRFRGDRDLVVVPDTRVSSLDPTADQTLELGCKVGFDATRPFAKPSEKFEKAEIPLDDRIAALIRRYGVADQR
jgi:UbiD family decarboxylase